MMTTTYGVSRNSCATNRMAKSSLATSSSPMLTLMSLATQDMTHLQLEQLTSTTMAPLILLQ